MTAEDKLESLVYARDYLKAYFILHRMTVNDVIGSVWARGVHSGRQESINVLDEAIAKHRENAARRIEDSK